jgi:DNA-binding beta-propeller fold protein YncE
MQMGNSFLPAKLRLFVPLCLYLMLNVPVFSQDSGKLAENLTLPNGWSLTPAGKQIGLGDLPLNVAVSPDQDYAAVTNNGRSKQSIHLINLKTQTTIDTFQVGKAWFGLVFSDDGKHIYASGGNDNWILRFIIRDEKLYCTDTFRLGEPWPVKISVAGISVNEKQKRIYTVTKENNSLYILNSQNKKIIKQIPLGGEGYTCILSPDKKHLYCSCWGCGRIVIFNTTREEMEGTIEVGSNPNEIAIDRKGRFLYVANANDNTVSVIDLRQKKIIEILNSALYPSSPAGSTTNGLALSEDDRTLYIANADNNCLAVFDVSFPGNSRGEGFIPTGWYPDCVRIAGNTLLVVNGKGLTSLANPKGPNPTERKEKSNYSYVTPQKGEYAQHIGSLFMGTLSIIEVPGKQKLAEWTQQVYKNTPYSKEIEQHAHGAPGNPVPFEAGQKSPVKYIFYIVKENRSYDQVLGDIPEGNGDTSLVLFGRKITPNQHAIAKEFVLLDNFYVDGEVSADGHNWSLGAYATDYLEKNWPTAYGGRGGSYDAEGTRAIANNKDGFIWDYCKRSGVSYRTYGEFADDYKANIPVLEGHFCKYYTSWDQQVLDTTRFHQWKRDFDSLLKINQVPQLNTLRFINDHTQALWYGCRTPYASVADNDYAVGLFVDYLSKSPIWKECAIFILEDDAQNGPDHVDAHRSTGYLAGGFVKTGFVDHTPYSTSSFLRTIELILGLPPMSQYDAAAEPLWRCFDSVPSHKPFDVRPPETDLFARNGELNEWQRKSEKFDFGREDRVPEDDFNKVLWYACKGLSSPCPAPVHAAFIRIR